MIAERLRELRAIRDWSREELAVRAGLSHGSIQRIEQGRQDPRGDSLGKLADALGVTVDALLGRTPVTLGPEDTLPSLARAS